MLHRLSELRGATIDATDGEAGIVRDAYIEADSWQVRRLGIEVDHTPSGHVVALPVDDVVRVYLGGFMGRAIAVHPNRGQVQQCAPVDLGPLSLGRPPVVTIMEPLPREQSPFGGQADATSQAVLVEAIDELTLFSADAVSRYAVTARDGAIGQVKDLVVDDRTWHIPYLVVDTRKRWPGRSVLIDTHDVGEVDAAQGTVHLKLIRDEIRNAREYDSHMPLFW